MIVVRIDEATLGAEGTTLFEDLAFLAGRGQHPVVVAPTPDAARTVVQTMNRTGDIAVGVRGADAGTIPAAGDSIGSIQTRLLHTLLGAGYVPVIEPVAMGFSGREVAVAADEVASALARALSAKRAIFFHDAGGVVDAHTHEIIGELTPAEALALADDPLFPDDLRTAIRAAALGVRGGVGSAQILDGRIQHATIVEMLTMHRLGTRVMGTVYMA